MATPKQIESTLRWFYLVALIVVLLIISIASGCKEVIKKHNEEVDANSTKHDREQVVSGMKYHIFSTQFGDVIEVRNITLDSLMVAEFYKRYPRVLTKDDIE